MRVDCGLLSEVFVCEYSHIYIRLGKGGWGGVCGVCQGFQGRLSENGMHIENEFLAEDAWLQRQPIVEWVREIAEMLCTFFRLQNTQV